MGVRSLFVGIALICGATASPALANCGSGWSESFVPDNFSITASGDRFYYSQRERTRRSARDRDEPRRRRGSTQSMYAVSFSSACAEHDNCYGTQGNRKRSCDTQFYRSMLSACRQSIPRQAQEAQRSCIGLAARYNDVLRGQALAYADRPFSDRSIDLRLFPGQACKAYRRAQGDQSASCN